MSLGISSVSFAPKKNCEWKPGGICPKPLPNPNDVMKDRFEKQIERHEAESKAKPKEERTLGDWFNVANSFIRKTFDTMKESSTKY